MSLVVRRVYEDGGRFSPVAVLVAFLFLDEKLMEFFSFFLKLNHSLVRAKMSPAYQLGSIRYFWCPCHQIILFFIQISFLLLNLRVIEVFIKLTITQRTQLLPVYLFRVLRISLIFLHIPEFQISHLWITLVPTHHQNRPTHNITTPLPITQRQLRRCNRNLIILRHSVISRGIGVYLFDF